LLEVVAIHARVAERRGKQTGRFRGEVFSDDTLVIGEGALVEAEIDIGEIIVQGTVVGNIKAKRSMIHAPGRVKGDIHTPSLQIDKGVIFEGRSFMEGMVAPKAAAAAAAAPAQAAPAKQTGPTPVKP